MKVLTRVVLSIVGVLTAVGVVCFLLAWEMGFDGKSFQNMIQEGKFTFDFGDGFHLNWGSSDEELSSSDVVNYTDILSIKNLDVEYGAGEFTIRYEDTDKVSVESHDVIGFETNIKDGTLIVKGDLSTSVGHESSMVIILPEEFVFDEVKLELGASAATAKGLSANSLKIELGAGEATFTDLDVLKLNAEVGVGQLNLNLVESEEDYNYQLECGIGEINFGSNSYAGLGSSNTVNRDGATRSIDIDCGIGEVNVKFNN